MSKKTYRFIGILLGILSIQYVLGQPITVVKDQVPYAQIVVAPDASKQVKETALFLQEYVLKSTNTRIPITTEYNNRKNSIHVGRTLLSRSIKLNSKNPEAFTIRYIDAKNFVISGNTDWGTEYGVYEFLERFLGIAWLIPTDIGIDIPTLNDLYIPSKVNINESPAFFSRRLAPLSTEHPANLFDQWGRINRVKKNVEFSHNLDNIFDVNRIGKKRPDFYPFIDGKREIPGKGHHDWQPNFLAEGLADSASTTIIRYFKKFPNVSSYSLSINDSKRFDQSSLSVGRRNGRENDIGFEDVSDEYYTWANSVASKVNSVFPEKLFGTLAYKNVFAPPSQAIGVNSNIVPFIVNERIRWANREFRENDINHTQQWLRISKNVGWYDYAYGISYLLPRAWPHIMSDYLQWANKSGVKYYVAELYPNWGEGPKAWVLTKLLWNPHQDVDVLLDKWYTKYAGIKAAPRLKAYFLIWENFWTKDIQKSSWYNIESQYLLFTNLAYINNVPDRYIKQSDRLLKEAYDLAETSIQKERVRKLQQMWEIYKMALEATEKTRSTNLFSPSMKSSKRLIYSLNKLKEDSLHSQISEIILNYIEK